MIRNRALFFFVLLLLSARGMAQSDEQLRLAKELFASGKYEEAIVAADRVIATNRLQDEANFIKGRSQMELGVFIYAIDNFTEVLKFNEKSAEAYALRAYCYFRLMEYRSARYDLIEACQIDTSNALYHYNLGDVEQHMNKLNDAVRSYTLALKYRPVYVEAFTNRGQIYIGKQEYIKALHDFDSALKYNQNSPELLMYRGIALAQLKRSAEAVAMFDRSIRLKPNNPVAYYNRGRARFDMKKFPEAIEDINKAITLDEQMEIAYFTRALAVMEIDRKRREEACEDLKRSLRLGYTEAISFMKKYCE